MVETRGRILEEMNRLFGLEERFVASSGNDPVIVSDAETEDTVQEHTEDVDKRDWRTEEGRRQNGCNSGVHHGEYVRRFTTFDSFGRCSGLAID